MRGTAKAVAMLAAVALVAPLAPPTMASEGLTLEQMYAEIDGLEAALRQGSPEFWTMLREAGLDLPDQAMGPVLSAPEAMAHTRLKVVYGTDVAEYAAFILAIHDFYQTRGALGVAALKDLTGEEIAALVASGALPSHESYKKFNLLGFYASLLDPENEQWLLTQPKTNARAQERVEEVLAGVTPEMRADAAEKLGQAMAMAYAEIVQRGGPEGLDLGAADVPLPATPAVTFAGQAVPSPDGARDQATSIAEAAMLEAKYRLTAVVPLAADVKLTSMNELTIVLEQLTQLTQVFERLEQYYYEYNYYYHYEFLQQFWWLYDYRVDHIEKRDRIVSETFVRDTYELTQYLYHYQDLINVKGLISGVLALDYEQVAPDNVEGLLGPMMLEEAKNTPAVDVLLDYVMPITFDITDELSLYFQQEVVNHVLNHFKVEYHYYWEYHIRNYWRWDPLDDLNLPFANADLSDATDYVVSVSEDLEVGKVLNVIPVGELYREASISVFAPASAYPLLDKAAVLDPAPASFLVQQLPAGETAQKLVQYAHVGPAPNAADLRVNAMPFTDGVVALTDGTTGGALATYGQAADVLGRAWGNPAALYELLPSRVAVPVPDVSDPASLAPSADAGVETYQVLGWETSALPTFVPQYAFAGVRVLDSAGASPPLLVNVNARGLGAPVTFAVDLNAALTERLDRLQDAAGEKYEPDVPSLDAVPGAEPVAAWAEDVAAYATDLVAWARDAL